MFWLIWWFFFQRLLLFKSKYTWFWPMCLPSRMCRIGRLCNFDWFERVFRRLFLFLSKNTWFLPLCGRSDVPHRSYMRFWLIWLFFSTIYQVFSDRNMNNRRETCLNHSILNRRHMRHIRLGRHIGENQVFFGGNWSNRRKTCLNQSKLPRRPMRHIRLGRHIGRNQEYSDKNMDNRWKSI